MRVSIPDRKDLALASCDVRDRPQHDHRRDGKLHEAPLNRMPPRGAGCGRQGLMQQGRPSVSSRSHARSAALRAISRHLEVTCRDNLRSRAGSIWPRSSIGLPAIFAEARSETGARALERRPQRCQVFRCHAGRGRSQARVFVACSGSKLPPTSDYQTILGAGEVPHDRCVPWTRKRAITGRHPLILEPRRCRMQTRWGRRLFTTGGKMSGRASDTTTRSVALRFLGSDCSADASFKKTSSQTRKAAFARCAESAAFRNRKLL
jgi:hypothetical protein